MINGKRAFDLLNKIGFVRTSGTKEELDAAHIILDEIKDIGLKGDLEPFEVYHSDVTDIVLEVTEPYQKQYQAKAYLGSGNIEGEYEFKYVQDLNDVDLSDVRGKCILMNTRPRIKNIKKIIDSGAIAFITMTGSLKDKEDEVDLKDILYNSMIRKYGYLPGFVIHVSSGQEMVLEKASKVKLKLKQVDRPLTSHNVIVRIPGKIDEEINFTAHYDSVPFSTGVYDNGAGSVIIMELLRYFKEHQPYRTLNFIWCGSEEIGLEGSKYYVENHSLDKSILTINVDVGGCVLGRDEAWVTGDESIIGYLDGLMKEKGYSLNIKQDVYSSDSTPFANKGVPAVSFMRSGDTGRAFIHCRDDVIDYLSSDSLENTAKIVLEFAYHVVNAKNNVINQNMPEKMIKALHEYLDIKDKE